MKVNFIKKGSLTWIGLIFIAYITLIECDNKPLFLYGGYVVTIGCTVLSFLMSGKLNKIHITAPCVMLIIFTMYCFAGQSWAWDETLVATQFRLILVAVIMVVIMTNYFIMKDSADAILYAIAMAGVVLSLYVIVSYGGLSNFYEQASLGTERLGSDIKNVNSIGVHCAYSAAVLMYFAVFRKKYICFFVMLLPIIVAIASASRKALILLIVGAIMVVLLSQKDKRGVINFFRLLILLVIVYYIFIQVMKLPIMGNVQERMEMFFNAMSGKTSMADGSSLIRKRMIEVGLNQFSKTPFLGIGLGNSAKLNVREIGFDAYSHNDYIEHLVNGGIIGFCLYYGAVALLLKKHIHILLHNRKNTTVAISFILIIMQLVANMASVTYYGSLSTYVFFILWITVVYGNSKKQEM